MFIAQKDTYLPPPARMPQGSTEEVPEKSNKKKRWWGDLFRRSNKSRRKPSDSSSDEEDNRRLGFLGRKRHSDRGSKDVTNSFLINPGLRDVPRGRSLDSVKSPERNNKRRIKAKVEASRELLRDSSSDEASSYTSSLHSGGSFPRRSRAARTERHIRRLSRDLELQNNVPGVNNKAKWSANVVYQECKEYDRKYRAKARSATPSPAQSPKVKRPAGRATSFDNIKSSPPPPPPRKLPEQRPVSFETPMRVYNPPVYTAPPQPRTKARYQPEYVSEPWLPSEQSPEEATKKPPAAPPRRQISNEERRRQQNNLEEALNELEAIYKKLASEDGQDNISDTMDEKRPLEDDMAYRRLNKREPSSQDVREIMSQAGSYLLVSPTLSPPAIMAATPTPPPMTTNGHEPDITYDDVVYRTMQHTNNTLKISDPQPPFGIPLGPISPSPPSDYLHVEAKPRFDYKPSKTPDVVRDDLAFRNLRKDAKEIKKKKAVRSLSANLTNIIRNNNNFNMHNNNLEGKSHSFQDIPEELRMAQHVFNVRKQKEDLAEENRKKYLDELYASENDLLRELEEEARATSVQLDEELRQLNEEQGSEPTVEALYSRSMTDLLKELTKNLDYDFGFNDEPEVVIANCQTCDTQSTKQPENRTKHFANNSSNHHTSGSATKRIDIAESRRQFFESPDFSKKIDQTAYPRSSRNHREYDKDNLFTRYGRSPSNPETSYNEKFINGHSYNRMSRSPLRTISADSSRTKENIQSFIERPFSRTTRSPILETSKSFNDKYSPRLSRSPISMIANGKPKSFSNEKDFLNKEINFEQYNRNKITRSPVNFPILGKGKLYNQYEMSDTEKTGYNLRSRLKSPVELGSTEKFNKKLDKPYQFNRSGELSDSDPTNLFVETYRRLYANDGNARAFDDNIDNDVSTISRDYNVDTFLGGKTNKKIVTNDEMLTSFDNSLVPTLKSNHSEDIGYYKTDLAQDFNEKEMSRSFDSGLLSSMIRKSPDHSVLHKQEMNNMLEVGGNYLEEDDDGKFKSSGDKNFTSKLRRSPCLDSLDEHHLENLNISKHDQQFPHLLGESSSCLEQLENEDDIDCGKNDRLTVTTTTSASQQKQFIQPPTFISLSGSPRSEFDSTLEFDGKLNSFNTSSTVEVVQQKRRSFAGTTDTQVDEPYPKEMMIDQQQLKSPRTPIDVEAIEQDTLSSREPSPQQRCCTLLNDVDGNTAAKSLVCLAQSSQPLQKNDLTANGTTTARTTTSSTSSTRWREEDIKEGSLVWTAYWLACSHQLIGLDMITILAILLAMISILLFILV